MTSQNELKSRNFPEPGEFWLAKFHYEEQDGRYKVRPVFVLKVYPYGVLVAFCGSQKLDTTSSRTDVLLDDEEAISVGLLREGKLSFGKRETLSLGSFKRRVGEIGIPGERLGHAKFREIAEAVQAAGIL